MLSENKRGKLFARRALLLGGFKASLLFTLIGRLYYLQIVESERYKTLADSNRIKLFLIPPMRGRILDRKERILAENQNFYRILLDPERANNTLKTATKLAAILHFSEEHKASLLKKVEEHKSMRPIMLHERLSWKDVARVEVNSPDLPGVSIDVGQTRNYPLGEDSAHVLGYLGPVSDEEIKRNALLNHPDFKMGKSGLEAVHEKTLRGEAGVKRMEVNAFGLSVRELSREPSTPGQDLNVTLDYRLQEFAAQRLGDQSGCVTVIDVETGGVVCMVSTPGFDPEQFSYGVSSSYWQELINNPDDPMINKVITNQYPPGSTFKLAVALAALESGVDPETSYYCPGYMILGRRRFGCWKEEGHGQTNMRQGIARSCNVFFFNTAKKLGIDPIEAMSLRMGLGKPLGINLPGEKGGLVPSRDWKRARFNDSWQTGDTLNIGIGQGFMLTTPLQLATMMARIASGNAVFPALTPQGNSLPFAHLGLDPDALKVVHDGVRMVMEPGGTAYGSRLKTKNIAMAGKTGTAQVISKKRYKSIESQLSAAEKKRRDHHALFIGFAPVSQPKYAISVVVEHGGSGSGAAAPVARDVMDKLFAIDKEGV